MIEGQQFHSDMLKYAFLDTYDVLNKLSLITDKISDDIKLLESYLSSLELDENFILIVNDNNVATTKQYHLNHKPLCMIIKEVIKWDHSKNRLKYIKYEANSDFDLSRICLDDKYYITDKFKITEVFLLKIRFEDRKRLLTFLPNLLLGLKLKYQYLL